MFEDGFMRQRESPAPEPKPKGDQSMKEKLKGLSNLVFLLTWITSIFWLPVLADAFSSYVQRRKAACFGAGGVKVWVTHSDGSSGYYDCIRR